MVCMRYQLLYLFLVWSIIAAVGGQDFFMAHDEVVRLGDDFTVNCSTLADLMYQSVVSDGPSMDDFVRPGKFKLSERKYDIIVQKMDETTVDSYECDFGYIVDNEIHHERTYFSLDAVDNLQCFDEVEVEVNEHIWLSCNISYIPANVYKPRIQLLDESALPISSSEQQTIEHSGFMSHQEMITGNVNIHGKHFQCYLDFEPEEYNPQPNYRPPTYTDTCGTVMTVFHAPTNVVITPRTDVSEILEVSVGDTFDCTANAYPIPSYEWFEGTVDEVSTLLEAVNDNQQLLVTEDMVGQLNVYTCQVTNDRGIARQTVQFNAQMLYCLDVVQIEVNEDSWLLCNISYIPANQYRPRIQLLDESALPISSSGQQTYERSGYMSHQEMITGSPNIHGKLFQCYMDFIPKEDNSQPNYRPPTYTDTCNTVVTVFYAPTNVVITPEPEGSETLMVFVGSTFNCTSSAYPLPSYDWFEGTVDKASTLPEAVSDDEQLLVTEDMVGRLNMFTCMVTNNRGTANQTVQFNACYGSLGSPGTCGATSLRSNTASLALMIMGMWAMTFANLVNKF